MWKLIRELDIEEVDTWIRTVGKIDGRRIEFYGIVVIDGSLLEALKEYRPDAPKKLPPRNAREARLYFNQRRA